MCPKKGTYATLSQGAIDKNSSPSDILDHIAGRRAEEVLVWVLRLYYYDHLPELVTYLEETLIPQNLLGRSSILGDSEKHPIVRNFNLKNIRALLTEGFTDVAIRRLCYDDPDFRPVYEQFSQEMGKDRLIDKLIEYTEQKNLIEALLSIAKEHNPTKYEKHQPYHLASIPSTGKLDFYEKAALLDEIQTWSDIQVDSDELQVVLTALSADASLERYFFRHLGANINWFEILRENGYLTKPPDPIVVGEKIDHPEWVVCSYLLNIASVLSAEVVNIAKQIQTKNVYVLKRLIWTAQQMPSDNGAEMAQIVRSWDSAELQQLSDEIFRYTMWLIRPKRKQNTPPQTRWADTQEI